MGEAMGDNFNLADDEVIGNSDEDDDLLIEDYDDEEEEEDFDTFDAAVNEDEFRLVPMDEIKCGKCDFIGKNGRELKEHLETAHVKRIRPERSESCDQCDFKAACFATLKRHKIQEHGELPEKYKVKKEEEEEEAKDDVDNDEKEAKEDVDNDEKEASTSTLVCRECGVECGDRDALMRHFADQHLKVEQEFKCSQCPFSTDYVKNLRAHVTREHRPKPKAKSNAKTKQPPAPGVHRCHICKNDLPDRQSLLQHRKDVHEKMDVCKDCGFSGSTYVVNMHINHKHLNKPNYFCDQCDYSTMAYHTFRQHVMSRHGPKQTFKCPHCENEYGFRASLRRHVLTQHVQVKDKVCDLCGFETVLAVTLHDHMKRVHHSEEKRFKCELCDYASHSKCAVISHVKAVHEKIKDLICQYCGFATASRTALKGHIRRKHTKVEYQEEEEEWRRCDKCNYKTMYEGCMLKHIESGACGKVTVRAKPKKDQSWVCDMCGFATSSQQMYRRHLVTHREGNDAAKVCPVCGKSDFGERRRNSGYTRHLKRKHPEYYATTFGREEEEDRGGGQETATTDAIQSASS